MQPFLAHPFDSDRLHEECGIFGAIGVVDASNFVALGLHALQHRGQEAGGIVAHHPDFGFNSAHRFGYVRDNFTKPDLMATLPGQLAIGHVRYSTAGTKANTAIRDVQPFFGEFHMGGCAIAHNGNITNAAALRRELIERGSIFQSSSDSECIIHLMARSIQRNIPERMKDALRRVEGAFSVIAMTRTKLIGVRDALGVRPLVLGRVGEDGYVLASETCALDIIGAEFLREIEPGEMVVISKGQIESSRPFGPSTGRFCIFEHVYFSRPDSIIGGRSVYETRRQIGVELAREAPVEADLVCPVPDSGTPAAIGFAQESGIPYGMGIIRNQYMGRTFIEPTDQIRNMGVRLKLNVNRALIRGKRVVLVDDSVVRGTTSRKIKDMILDAGAAEVHFRIASPPTAWPCFYGVDTPDRDKLLAANMSPEQMREWIGVDSLSFVSLDGLYRAAGEAAGRDPQAPRYCDACFSGDYPVAPFDQLERGFRMKVGSETAVKQAAE
ncbi:MULTISPECIES: amidophosphoribosyltransferase [Paracoccus]|jgi:amidophosphoribosyltransferase|uniref:Amidophosphoribosyltransferase n=3 Tax=Paracoccus TaxID=265 RepID=A0A5C4R670_9RHOB|nr:MULTISPECIES: amidophosphoribosyltransferase [Paracoccus]TYP60470.1 amidophosphoribosyltransferase [Stutzerimonas stutzeri]AZY94069.1 amidophosphoribosyltransferase [Paracoccus sp. Arc7-R13]KIX19068.1 amidophosphoribosyltransferase [Paracoccus sp. 228]KJZ33031.1 amidophosphoribosyltransferase [Paracoccus sp. S4493]MCO6362837.1 amidophosphoribosyltransferase [Paracoccus sp. 08]